jgi:hypothetical protein
VQVVGAEVVGTVVQRTADAATAEREFVGVVASGPATEWVSGFVAVEVAVAGLGVEMPVELEVEELIEIVAEEPAAAESFAVAE